MASDKFELLKKLNPNNTQGSAPLVGLKKLTREYRDLHNQIVERIWLIKLELNQGPAKNDTLNDELIQLENLLKEGNSEAKLTSLLKRIHAIETDLFGFSNAGKSSPYVL